MNPFNFTKTLAVFIALTVTGSFLYGQEFKTIGYFPTYRFSLVDEIELDKLTHLNIAFAAPNDDGFLTTNGVDIAPIVQRGHEAGLEVYIALAGAAASLADWAHWTTAANRSAFIHNIINYTHDHNLQGIDVDLEWGAVNDDYSGFVLELRDSVDQYELGLSVALPGIYRYPEVSDEALAAYDWINLMVYDLTGPWAPNNPGPHSPYSFAENSIDYWAAQGVSEDRMTLGVPFYGYDFTNEDQVTSITYGALVAMDTDNAELDQLGQIYYNGLPTITQKTLLALQNLSGIMIWEIGQDSFDEYSLLGRIAATINGTFPTAVATHDQEQPILYPNPARDMVHLRLPDVQSTRVRLFSTRGEQIQSQHTASQDIVSIDIHQLVAGMYFLMVDGDDFSKTFRLSVM